MSRLPGLFAYPNFPYLPTHRYIEEIVKVHFLNLTQMNLGLSNNPPTKKLPLKKYKKIQNTGFLYFCFSICLVVVS